MALLEGIIVALITITLGNVVWLERTVAKLKNEVSHIQGDVKSIQDAMVKDRG